VVSFTPLPLYPQGKSPWYPLNRRLGGLRAVLDAVVKRKIPSPRRESNPRTPIIQPVAQRYTTELSRLLSVYPYNKKQQRVVFVKSTLANIGFLNQIPQVVG
jgi:hypothetical protein